MGGDLGLRNADLGCEMWDVGFRNVLASAWQLS